MQTFCIQVKVFSTLWNFAVVTMRDAIILLLVKFLNGEYGNSLALLFQVKVRSQTQHKITSEPYTKSKIQLSPRFRFNHEYLHLVNRTWYAKCNPRKYPSHMSCPSFVYGVGRTKKMAIDNAKAYADLTGDKGCGQYSKHCHAKKFII